MARPRILLCPQFTEVEWTIAPRLAEWADVATFDAPGVGDEPVPGGELAGFTRAMIVERGLQEIDARRWDSYFVVGESWGTATAVMVAAARPEAVLGIALGHAALDHSMDGERPAVVGDLVAAMTQLLRTDYDSFVRYGITQLTQGGINEETAGRMLERFPPMEVAARVWETLVGTPEPVGDLLRKVGKPLLLAKHEGCLLFTSEGYEDAVAAFPGAVTASVQVAPTASDEFAVALRDFCEGALSSS